MRFLSSFGDNAAIVLVKPIESIEFLCRMKTTMGKSLTRTLCLSDRSLPQHRDRNEDSTARIGKEGKPGNTTRCSPGGSCKNPGQLSLQNNSLNLHYYVIGLFGFHATSHR
jgi:hypothetical protein